jgi:hypothetical protein
MTQVPGILLLDDGELNDVAELLDELELFYERHRGGDVPDTLPPPTELLITTPRRASVVRRGSPTSARNGRPVRIVAVSEDSTAMRRMMRRLGFSLLVRVPTHQSIWRLLIRRALYQGDERRRDTRVTVGSQVSVSGGAPSGDVVLMDISNRGCRLMSSQPFESGEHVSLALPERTTGDEPLVVSGTLLRTATDLGDDGEARHTAAMTFDVDLAVEQRSRLGAVINKWSMGPQSIMTPGEGGALLPPVESHEIPGLTLDEETDPAIRVGEHVSVISEGGEETEDEADRRTHFRGAFASPVIADGTAGRRVLMGRDLSPGGMRIERLADLEIGDRFKLALYGPTSPEPFEVEASVMRDDGENGLALAFDPLPAQTAAELEKLVACLPEVESLEEGEARGLGAVISEILDDRWRLR